MPRSRSQDSSGSASLAIHGPDAVVSSSARSIVRSVVTSWPVASRARCGGSRRCASHCRGGPGSRSARRTRVVGWHRLLSEQLARRLERFGSRLCCFIGTIDVGDGSADALIGFTESASCSASCEYIRPTQLDVRLVPRVARLAEFFFRFGHSRE